MDQRRALVVLVVDDEPALRLAHCTVLRMLRQVALEADSGERALQYLTAFAVDVVLTDLNMSGMTGVELARLIRARFARPRPYVILLSGMTDGTDPGELRQAGIDAILCKPLEVAALEEQIEVARALLYGSAAAVGHRKPDGREPAE